MHWLLAIINDILDFSKIEAGKMTIERIPFDFRETLSEVLELVTPRAAGKQLTLRCEWGDAVPARIVSDLGRSRQVLLNLLGNAIRFTPERGAITVRVSIDAPGDDTLRVSVVDTGIGIPQEKQPLLFNKFVQADSSTTRRYGGTGLGLAISKRLVEMMGGQIGFESEEQRGSVFWFTLPLANGEGERSLPENSPAPTMAPRVKAGSSLNLSGAHVLVAEDIEANQLLIRRLLEKHGCQVTLAGDGRQAVNLFRKYRYDLVLIDCHMPVLDGFEASREIREQECQRPAGTWRTPIIAVTADAMEGDRERCLQAGMDDYLSKPLRITELDAVLSKWLAGHRGAAA